MKYRQLYENAMRFKDQRASWMFGLKWYWQDTKCPFIAFPGDTRTADL